MNDFENFQATVSHRRPGRILYHGDFVEDLRKRVVAHIGGKDPAVHYGMARSRGIGPRRPEGLPRIDYSKYWQGETLPEGAKLDGNGVAMVPSDGNIMEIIEKYGRNGGLMISPTHVMEPEVPIANIDAFFSACREYGTF
jgi:hypothetical protein